MKTATRFPKWPFHVFRNPPVRVAAVGGVAPVVAALSHVAILDVIGSVAAVGGTVVAILSGVRFCANTPPR